MPPVDRPGICPNCKSLVHWSAKWICCKAAFALLMLPLCSCTSFVKELHKPPYPLALTQHSRVVGLKASWQGYGIQIGFVSESVTFIPVSTNKLFLPPIDDQFSLGQHALDTSIKERITTGYDGAPPPPLMRIFSPKDRDRNEPPKTNSLNPSAHSQSFLQQQSIIDQGQLTPWVGLFDSAAPVFTLKFSETERRPIAVQELTAGSAMNIYSVISNPITYPDMPPLPK